MIGIVLLSHGKLAEGMLDSCRLFFGDDLPQITYRCLDSRISPEQFDTEIDHAVNEVDDGCGCLVLCDLFGGTPSNRCVYKFNERTQIISGFNFAVLLEFLGIRDTLEDISQLDVHSLIETGKSGIVSLNTLFGKLMETEE